MCCTITKLPNKHICRNKKAKDRLPVDYWRNLGEIVLTFWHPDLDLLILGIGFVSSMYTCTFTSADLQMIVF